MIKRVGKYTAEILFSVVLSAGAFGADLRGVVFLDSNANGVFDKGDLGVKGVAVSDGGSVVSSGVDGTFLLTSNETRPQVFISVPSGYVIPPKGAWHIDVNAMPDGKQLQFALTRDPKSQENFSFVQVTDTHLQSSSVDRTIPDFHYKYSKGSQTWRYLFEGVVPEILSAESGTSFIIDTGDMGIKETATSPADDAKLFKGRTDALRVPYFMIPGNHDGRETLEISPPHYSFNRGKIHFVALKRFPDEEGVELTRQFEWLAKDLALLPTNTPVIVFIHAPFGPENYGREKGINRLPEFNKIMTGVNVKALVMGHIHQHVIASKDSILHVYTPSFNFGGGWNQDFWGMPPAYRVFEIVGEDIAVMAVKSVEAEDNPLWVMSPKDRMVVEGAMYPYFNSCSFWNGKIKAMFLGKEYADIQSVSFKIDGGDYKPLSYFAAITGQQGEWLSAEDIREGMRKPGEHTLSVRAESRAGKKFERTLTLFSGDQYIDRRSQNILKNSSLEDKSTSSDSPDGWNVDGKTVVWDRKESSSGARSLRIEMSRSYGSFYLCDNLPVESDGIYNLSLMAKGSNIQDMSYAIFPGMSDAHLFRFPAGTYGWTRINTQFRLKPGVSEMGLCIANATKVNRAEGAGVLWIDDLSLRRVK